MIFEKFLADLEDVCADEEADNESMDNISAEARLCKFEASF